VTGVFALFIMNCFIQWKLLEFLTLCLKFVLHCVYLPRINKALTELWNLHPVQTARNWFTYHIMLNSMIQEENILDAVNSDCRIDPKRPFVDDDTGTPETVAPR